MEVLDLQGSTSAKTQYAILKSFWAEFGRDGNKHHRSAKGKAKTIARLKDIGDYIILRKNTPYKNTIGRGKFERVKADRHSLKSHRACFACGGTAEVRHHIIWIKHGGLNSKKNLVSLCRACHALLHDWL